MSVFPEFRSGFEAARQLQNNGQFAGAEAAWRQLLSTAGNDPAVLRHLGECCVFQKKFSEAETHFRRALALSRDAETLNALSCALGGLGRNDEALQVLAEARALSPDNAAIWLYTGNALAAMSRTEEALRAFRKAAELNPRMAQAHFNAGGMLVRLGRPTEAEPYYRQVLALNPAHTGALNNLGNILMLANRPGEAIPVFEQAIRLAPSYTKAWFNLGHALARANRHEDALIYYRRALELEPGFVRALDKMATSLNTLGRTGEAIQLYTAALKRQPDMAAAHFGLGTSLQITGDFEGAHREIRKALALEPKRPFYWNAMIQTKAFRDPADPDIAAIEDLAAHADAYTGEDKSRIFFMLGKIRSDLKQPAKAFAAWQRGNQLARAGITYDSAREIATLNRISQTFSADFLADRAGNGVMSDLPVFVVGMPRSGTSLIEQILASHSEIYGAGELTDLSRIFADEICHGTPVLDPERLTADALHRLGESYLAHIKPRAPDARRIVDKMPGNFAYAGLIRLALPGAKIIHVHRDARDCCLSCYSKQFIAGQPFTYDLTELGQFYRGYENLMAHWRSVLPPENFLEVQYEDLVQDFEPVARSIIRFCGLEWQDACRDFYKTRTLVRTASQAQVRQPLYASSIGRWRHYEKELAPLLSALEA